MSHLLPVGTDLTTATLYAATTHPTDADARRSYRRWVDRQLHRAAARAARAARPDPVVALSRPAEPIADPTPVVTDPTDSLRLPQPLRA